MGGFDRLAGALQYKIVNELGWKGLRPVQSHTIDAICDGDNCVVLAPTAGGKTEAAFFPILSQMHEESWRPVSVIYLSPIRALLNNQEDRIARLAGFLGRRAFKWHGDVTQSARKKFLREPADILLTTPESLEAMMMSARVPARSLFSGLRAVIIDEVHAFADDDRGAHLSCVLERLSRFCGHDLQRIGLSATVGNPEAILQWVSGSSKRAGRVVDPGGARKAAELSIDFVKTIENAAQVVTALHPGEKRLVFVDSRRGAEDLGKLLHQRGVMTFVTHGSLSVSERREAEEAFAEGKDRVIVSTSALELGIDVGDLDRVLQIDAPPSVASFLQRMGRTGRRPDTSPNCTFLVVKDKLVLQAAAIVKLYREGYVEPVVPRQRASHIFAHQVMALCIEKSGMSRGELWAWLEGAAAFRDLPAADREAIVDHMLAEEILSDQEGKLWLGPAGEKRFGRAGFRELYAVFDAPRSITVRWDTRDIGTVDASFLEALDSAAHPPSFVLAGRPWKVVHIEWQRGICVVVPAPEARAARWGGAPRYLSYAMCQAIRGILVSDDEDPSWSARTRAVIESKRREHDFLRDEPSPIVESASDLTWWTFAGGAANVLLARVIEAELGGRCVSRNFSVTLQGEAARSLVAVGELLRKLRAEGRPTDEDALRHAEGARRGRLSKFQICLPDELVLDLIARAALDAPAARAATATHG
jgi:ATP-dependent helicase Lhr and Lhr-like helicase